MKKSESQNIEYKRSWHDEYLKWVCGFANAKGGTIWIGIDDDKSVHGVAGAKKLMEDIPNKIKDTMGLMVDVALLKRQKKDVLRIAVPESDFPVAYHGEYHYRTGSTKQQLTGFALTQFLFHKMHLSAISLSHCRGLCETRKVWRKPWRRVGRRVGRNVGRKEGRKSCRFCVKDQRLRRMR